MDDAHNYVTLCMIKSSWKRRGHSSLTHRPLIGMLYVSLTHRPLIGMLYVKVHFVQAAESVIRNSEVVCYSGAAIALYGDFSWYIIMAVSACYSVDACPLLGVSVNGESTVYIII